MTTSWSCALSAPFLDSRLEPEAEAADGSLVWVKIQAEWEDKEGENIPLSPDPSCLCLLDRRLEEVEAVLAEGLAGPAGVLPKCQHL